MEAFGLPFYAKGGMLLQHMNYETFIHHVALDLKRYLPKSYAEYEVVVKCERNSGQKAKLTLEKNHTTFYRQIDLELYYTKYQNGFQWELMMKELADSLVNSKELNKRKCTPSNCQVLILTIGGVVLFIGGYYLTIRKRKK